MLSTHRLTHRLFLLHLTVQLCEAWISPDSFDIGQYCQRMDATKIYEHSSDAVSTDAYERRQIRLAANGNKAQLRSRFLPIDKNWSITVWEWENPADVVESYWEAQASMLSGSSRPKLLDPFGIVSWPGSVVAAQALRSNPNCIRDKSVLILGAGVGVETQAAAELGAKEVLATDIHPTTLLQLELGIAENPNIQDKTLVTTAILDLFGKDPIPKSDLVVVADVLYNEQVASQVASRLVEAWVQNPSIVVLVTDSQRFVDFTTELNEKLEAVAGPTPVCWDEQSLKAFTGSGVCINEDQTYDVKVRTLWIGIGE